MYLTNYFDSCCHCDQLTTFKNTLHNTIQLHIFPILRIIIPFFTLNINEKEHVKTNHQPRPDLSRLNRLHPRRTRFLNILLRLRIAHRELEDPPLNVDVQIQQKVTWQPGFEKFPTNHGRDFSYQQHQYMSICCVHETLKPKKIQTKKHRSACDKT